MMVCDEVLGLIIPVKALTKGRSFTEVFKSAHASAHDCCGIAALTVTFTRRTPMWQGTKANSCLHFSQGLLGMSS